MRYAGSGPRRGAGLFVGCKWCLRQFEKMAAFLRKFLWAFPWRAQVAFVVRFEAGRRIRLFEVRPMPCFLLLGTVRYLCGKGDVEAMTVRELRYR